MSSIRKLVIFMIVSSLAVTAPAQNRITGTATGTVDYQYLTPVSLAQAFVDLDWAPVSLDLDALDTVVVRCEAPAGLAFTIASATLADLEFSLGFRIGPDAAGFHHEGVGTAVYDMLLGPAPTLVSAGLTFYDQSETIFTISVSEFPSELPPVVAMTAIELTYELPEICDTLLSDAEVLFDALTFVAFAPADPGDWLSLSPISTSAEEMDWSGIKRLYR